MPRWMFFCVAVCLLLMPLAPVQAQNAAKFESLEIDLWPEYDMPSVLVIYRIKLSADTALPANLAIRMPTAAGEPFNVAVRESDGMLYLASYTREVQGDWSIIRFTVAVPDVQFEYYDPGLKKDGSQRSYQYTWSGDYPVRVLTMQVQQPVDATQMQISPSLGTGIAGEAGVMYYNAQVGSLDAGTQFSLSFTYDKQTDTLTKSSMQPQSSQSVDINTPGRSLDVNRIVPWALGGLGVALIIGALVWYFVGDKKQKSTDWRREIVQNVVSEQSGEGGVYCHQCGKRAVAGDRFCRACGTQLRRED